MSTSPTSSPALWELEATTLAKLIRDGAISSREAVASCLGRIEAVNPQLNAVVQRFDAEALAAADAADAARARGEALAPLHGVPVTIKVNVDQKGHANTNAVPSLRDNVSAEDNPVVANMRKAGAVIVGRTNTPGFSMRWFTENTLHGDTLNPWNAGITPGGSSGGAGSATAAGMAPIGHGNDIAGSVRYPAYCNGLFGMRPSYGRVPSFNATAGNGGGISSQIMAVQGPLTRSARDNRLAYAAMAQPDWRDPRSFSALAVMPPPERPRHAAIVTHPGGGQTHPAIVDAIKASGRALEAAGWTVEEVEPPSFREAVDLWGRIGGPDVIARLLPNVLAKGDDGIKKAFGLWGHHWGSRDPQVALDGLLDRLVILRQWSEFLEKYAVLVLPTSCDLPYPVHADLGDEDSNAAIMEAQRAILAISALSLPGLAVPTGTHDGIPVGVQIVAGMYREDVIYDAAEVLEAQLPTVMPKPVSPKA